MKKTKKIAKTPTVETKAMKIMAKLLKTLTYADIASTLVVDVQSTKRWASGAFEPTPGSMHRLEELLAVKRSVE